MNFPDNTPVDFSGAKVFVETHGDRVWSELCDMYLPDIPISVKHAAGELSSLIGYANKPRYLRAVLRAAEQDYKNRPGAYTDIPFYRHGKNLRYISL